MNCPALLCSEIGCLLPAGHSGQCESLRPPSFDKVCKWYGDTGKLKGDESDVECGCTDELS